MRCNVLLAWKIRGVSDGDEYDTFCAILSRTIFSRQSETSLLFLTQSLLTTVDFRSLLVCEILNIRLQALHTHGPYLQPANLEHEWIRFRQHDKCGAILARRETEQPNRRARRRRKCERKRARLGSDASDGVVGSSTCMGSAPTIRRSLHACSPRYTSDLTQSGRCRKLTVCCLLVAAG